MTQSIKTAPLQNGSNAKEEETERVLNKNEENHDAFHLQIISLPYVWDITRQPHPGLAESIAWYTRSEVVAVSQCNATSAF